MRLDIHYIHQKPTGNINGKKIVPLLLIHGWPGSVREFYGIIPLLTQTQPDLDIVFEVIAPSLVGFGWSQPTQKPGLGAAEMSVIFRNLMVRLGYQQFYIQGGDWGSIIGSHLTTLFPENVLGYHSNMCFISTPLSLIKRTIASYLPSYFIEKENEEFFLPMGGKIQDLIIESGYMHIQSTKPDTVGAALTGNPIGLAAYILEKFSTWTNINYRDRNDGGLKLDHYSRDALLDNLMVYYLTNSITTSMRLYAESFNLHQLAYNLDRVPTNVPSGCARFKYDLAHPLDWELQEKYHNLVHSTFNQKGGHFIALEAPKVLKKDFIEFIKKTRA